MLRAFTDLASATISGPAYDLCNTRVCTLAKVLFDEFPEVKLEVTLAPPPSPWFSMDRPA